MSVPEVTRGRNAWRTTGKDNGSRWYKFIDGAPIDGAQPTRDENYQAVAFGVRAIQTRLNSYGIGILVDGKYGQATAAGVKRLQQNLGLAADGVVGPATAKAMWKDLLIWYGGVHHVPASQLYGFMMLESLADPGALGEATPADRGLSQINEDAHPSVTDAQAFDPNFAINYTAKRLSTARIRYSGKSVDLKNRCAIAQHNSPLWADQWYALGAAPNGKIEDYVDSVLAHALEFKA